MPSRSELARHTLGCLFFVILTLVAIFMGFNAMLTYTENMTP